MMLLPIRKCSDFSLNAFGSIDLAMAWLDQFALCDFGLVRRRLDFE